MSIPVPLKLRQALRLKAQEKNIRAFPLYVLCGMLILTSCSPKIVNLTAASGSRGKLVSYKKVGSMTSQDVVNEASKEGDVSSIAQFDLDLYRVIYNSVHAGQMVELSGLVFVPKNSKKKLDLIQYHHGTSFPISQEKNIPSYYTGSNSKGIETYMLGPSMASSGFIVSLPDYSGFGHSNSVDHPYSSYNMLAEQSVDMLRATSALITELQVGFSSDIYLSGWSQGANIGLATLKQIQAKYSTELNVVESSFLAGPYDFDNYMYHILGRADEKFKGIPVYSWMFYALNEYLLDTRPAEEIYKRKVSNQNKSYLILSKKPKKVFQPSFISNVLNGKDIEVISALESNNTIKGWVPQTPITFHHGNKDQIVFQFNSRNAYESFKSAGATVYFVEHDGNHFDLGLDYTLQTIELFQK